MSLWESCKGVERIREIIVEPWRVVEAQHILSSRDLVDTVEEHDILEDMLELSKPSIQKSCAYLIFTPFRYPPLKYGSRFGQTFEPSLWYGSLELETAFAETAYYRQLFLKDTAAELDYIELLVTAFNVSLKTSLGIDLTQPPFHDYAAAISAKDSYLLSQELGSNMREDDIEAFIYYSARFKAGAKNIAAFTPKVFGKIVVQQTWQCIANKSVVEFTRVGGLRRQRFSF